MLLWLSYWIDIYAEIIIEQTNIMLDEWMNSETYLINDG